MVLEPEVIMPVDQQGTSALIAYGIVVVEDVQGQSCSKLLSLIFDSDSSKSMCTVELYQWAPALIKIQDEL